jgi:hypothetical protein
LEDLYSTHRIHLKKYAEIMRVYGASKHRVEKKDVVDLLVLALSYGGNDGTRGSRAGCRRQGSHPRKKMNAMTTQAFSVD